MTHNIFADCVVLIHFCWVVFLFLGVFLGVKNKVVKIFHISGFAFAFVIQIFGWYCPLTTLEVWLISRQDSVLSYAEPFIV